MASILKNTSALFIAHLAGRLLAFALLILMPRYFSDPEIGAYFWAAAVTNMMAVFIVFGMHVPLVREVAIAKEKAREYISNALVMRLILSALTMTALVGGMHLFGLPENRLQLVLILGFAEILNVIAQLFRCTFRAFEQMQFEGLVVILERAFVFLVGGASMILGASLLMFCGVILIASVLNVSLSLGIMLRRFTKLSIKIRLDLCKELLVQSFPFALGGIFNIVYFRIDTVMLPALCRSVDGETAVAWYGLAYSLVTSLTIIPGAFTNALFPVLSRAFANEPTRFQQLYTHSLKLMFILALPIALGLAMLSEEIVALLWSHAAPGTIGGALRLLSWAGGLLFLNNVLGIVLRAADKRAAFAILIGLGMSVNIGLNLLLVPRMNHEGAALAMILTEGAMFLGGFVYISQKLVKLLQFGFALKSVLAATAMGFLVWLLRDTLSVVLLIPLAAGVYLLILICWGELRISDLRTHSQRSDHP